VRCLVLTGSKRAASLNTQLAALAAEVLAAKGAIVERASIGDFDCPSYDGDDEAAAGIPAPAVELGRRLEATNALVLASPEYNAAMPGVVKNVIDWVSRLRPQPFNEKQTLLMSASPSMVGGNRGLWSLRVPLEHLGARVYPDMFSLAQAHKQLGPDGRFVDATLAERFARTLGSFLDLVEASTHYACAKKRWFEFLGEHPEGVTARSQ
jgi:NAD(P)H-dependent FMN reductase